MTVVFVSTFYTLETVTFGGVIVISFVFSKTGLETLSVGDS